MINPCTRDCPDREPGCECEKRRAWKWQQEQINEARRKDNIVSAYKRDKIRSSKKLYRRNQWDE